MRSIPKSSLNLFSELAACKSSDLPPQQTLTLNSMVQGVHQPRTGQTIGVRTLVFIFLSQWTRVTRRRASY